MSEHSIRAMIRNCAPLKPLIMFRRQLISSQYAKKRTRLECGMTKRGQDASDAIMQLMVRDDPCLVGRFGSCELGVVAEQAKKGSADITTNVHVQALAAKGGFYPVTIATIRQFVELYIESMPNIDILGSWCLEELDFRRELRNAMKIPLGDIEPYFHARPWTAVLKGKRVLIVSPLKESIEFQYAKRRSLFQDPSVLPDFQLLTYKSIYEFNEEDRHHVSWFEAFSKMERDILSMQFDIAVLGCGPYGLPLANSIKQSGRKAVVMGGATQVWFGIKGARWDGDEKFRGLYNEAWIYPSQHETPKGAESLEAGCYWGPSRK